MLTDTYTVRKGAKLLSDSTLSEAIADWLVSNATISHPGDDIDETPIADEIRVALFGQKYKQDVAEELNDTITELTRPHGPVYHALDNGHGNLTLCTTRVRRMIPTANGGSVIVAKASRFVTPDPDVAMTYRINREALRLERAMENMASTIAGDIARIPAISSRVPSTIGRLHRVLNAELPQKAGTP